MINVVCGKTFQVELRWQFDPVEISIVDASEKIDSTSGFWLSIFNALWNFDDFGDGDTFAVSDVTITSKEFYQQGFGMCWRFDISRGNDYLNFRIITALGKMNGVLFIEWDDEESARLMATTIRLGI